MTIRDSKAPKVIGDLRYERYCAAFDWVVHCVEAGYALEATAVLESLLWDRLRSRFEFLKKEKLNPKTLIGPLCRDLLGVGDKPGCETDAEFRDAIGRIQRWLPKRNEALHATAKVFSTNDSPKHFHTILEFHKPTAEDGIACLQAFDLVDTKSRAKVGKEPASCPNAFFPKARAGGSRLSTWSSISKLPENGTQR